jgi:hypothetical protein
MSAHQRRLLLVGVVAIAATLIAVLGLDWFHARLPVADGGTARFDIGLRTVRICIDDHCESHRLAGDSAFGIFGPFTFWFGIVYTITLAIQVASRIVMGRALHQPMTTIGILLGVAVLAGLIVCGVFIAPASEAGGIHRTWAMTLLLLGVVAGFYTLYLAITEDVVDHQAKPLEDKPVFVARARPILDEIDGIALEPEAAAERDPFLPPEK